MPKKITYILLTFPKLTTTFVDREILALRGAGVEVQVYSLLRPNGPLSGYQKALQEKTIYLYPARLADMFAAHLYYAFRHPRRYFSTLFHLLTCPHPTLLSHRRTLRHFIQGIYTTYRLRHDPGDHIHAHFLNQSATIALIISRMLDIPYSVTVHASGELYSSPMIIREKLAEAKFIATCTSYNRDYLAELGKDVFDQKLLLNYHGLDLAQYSRRQAKPANTPVILSVGQLRERKGLIYLVRACGILSERGLEFCCRIVGEGPERELLECEIKRLGLAGQVVLTGALSQEELINHYEAANLFTLPTVQSGSGDRDGIPNVILEAMAMDLPVVSTWNSAIPEAIQDGKNGLLVPPRNSSALADALHLLLLNQPLAERLGAEGRRTVMERFNPQRNVQLLIDAFMA